MSPAPFKSHSAKARLAFAALLLCASWLAVAADAATPAARKVLILYSWHDGLPWQAGVQRGIQERLQQAPAAEQAEIFVESIDATRLASPGATEGLENYLNKKYAAAGLDAIITESQPAALFLLRHPALLPTAKRYAVNVAETVNLQAAQAIVIREDPGRALLAIPGIMPDRNHIVAIVDRSILGGRTIPGLQKAAASLPPGVRLEVWDSFSFDELIEKSRHLPQRTALLYFPLFQDRLGARATPRSVVERLAQATNAPVFVHHDTFLGTGVVGGYVLSAQGVGRLIAGIALGRPPQNPEAVDAIVKGYQFDDRQLQRWGIGEGTLPDPHVVTHRVASLWTTYRWQIGGVIVLLAAQALLILVLVHNVRRRRKALADLSRERDSLEQRVRARTLELRAREQRMQALFDHASEGITILSTSGALVAVNESYARMHGYTVQEVQTMDLSALSPEGEELPRAERRRRILSGEALNYEVTHHHKDGHAFPVEISSSLIAFGDEQLIQIFHRDITSRKLAEAHHNELEEQLRESQKMQAIGTLAGGIAHDFNNALATILGNLELARQDSANNPAALESLEEIRKAGTRARNLVQQILAFSRRQPSELKPLDVGPVMLEAVHLLRATVPPRISIDVHCGHDVPPVLGNATQIEQVLINLATNAMQAIHSGPGLITLRLDTVDVNPAMAEAHPALRTLYERHPGLTVRISVIDTGPGMDAATRERIFEPFFTTKPVNEGTGLGLSVVHGIVQGHEGVITVESTPGHGATFTIYLPAAPAVPASPPDAPLSDTTPALSLDGGQRILYVDDDASLLSLVKRLLERRGYRVSTYSEPRAALAALRAEPAAFDLLLTDYNMPGMSGLEVAREARIIRADLPVAVASGFIDETLREQAARAGVRELIFKADEVETFCAAVQRLATP